ncbi:S-adenosyl-L-methionine-dependent methyltransferase [Gaertneriomyces semiglobifer]|nr:S-adenosyl-L-methionine-dependent methyltransferase [Gaertneriomyces semiglobifer]
MDPQKVAQAQEVLAKQCKKVTDFQYNKLMTDYARNWDLFYKRNTTNFFKDRHWTDREYEELRPEGKPRRSKRLLELGCGVGNFVYPLLEKNEELFIYACDLSKRAVEFQDPKYNEEDCQAFVCDITSDKLTDTIEPESLDLVSALFVLSAIPPPKMAGAIENLKSVLKPGGMVLFRDYGLYDAAQLRFKSDSKLDEHFYTRADGTFSYFFSTDQIAELFTNAGFEMIENEYVCKNVVNRKRELSMDRIFVQCKARKKS